MSTVLSAREVRSRKRVQARVTTVLTISVSANDSSAVLPGRGGFELLSRDAA